MCYYRIDVLYIRKGCGEKVKISDRIIAICLCIVMSICVFVFPTMAAAPEITSASAILTDVNSDEILYQKGVYSQVLPSVSSRFMAIYTAIESGAEETAVIQKEWLDSLTNDKPRMGITPGEAYALKDLIRAVYLTDFYDVYLCLAGHIGSSPKSFVNMMNANARKLGMISTHYETLDGYKEGKEYTTPYDVHLLIKALSSKPLFREITADASYIMSPVSKGKEPVEINQKLNINDPRSEWYISGSRVARADSHKSFGHSIVFSVMRDNREILWISFGNESGDMCATQAGQATEFAFSDFKRVIYTKEEIKKLYKGESNLYIEPAADVYVTVPNDVEKAHLIASIIEKDRVATFKVVGNGVNFQKEVSEVKASGIRFIWEGILTIIRWILAGIIIFIVAVCILYFPISFVSAKRAKKARERKEEKVRKMKEKMKENQ